MPRWQTWCVLRPLILRPLKKISPAVIGKKLPMQLKIVVLPEPFGPMRPKISPFSTWKVTSFTARSPPKAFTNFFSSRSAMVYPFPSRLHPEDMFFDLCPVPHNTVCHKKDHENHDQAKNQRMSLADPFGGQTEKGTSKGLLNPNHDEGPHRRSHVGCHAADNANEDGHDGNVVERENHVGIDEGHVIHVKSACHPGEKGTDQERDILVERGVDSQRLGRILVFPDGNKVVAPLASNDRVDHQDAQSRKAQSDVVIRDFAPEALDEKNADHTLGQAFPVSCHKPDDFAPCKGGQGKIGASEPKTDPPHEKGEKHSHRASQQHPPPGRDLKLCRKNPSRVSAHSEKHSVAE